MINGAHVMIYRKDAEADRVFFPDVLEFLFVDVGEGGLISALPPAEAGIHPHDVNGPHEFYLKCDDVHAFVRKMKAKKAQCAAITGQPYGSMTTITLPGGGDLGVYQARPARPSNAKR